VKLFLERLIRYEWPTPDLDSALEAFERLGVKSSEQSQHVAAPPDGPPTFTFDVGPVESRVTITVVGSTDLSRHRLEFLTPDLDAARQTFDGTGGGYDTYPSGRASGIAPRDTAAAGCRVALIADLPSQGEPVGTFPLQRVDHLALVPPDLDGATDFWTDVFGVPLLAELNGPGFCNRQMRVGDVNLELLASTDPDGPLAGARPGLRPMVAFEVEDAQACVNLARSRGFTAPDPVKGALPGTITSTIAPLETAGLGIQLLQYL
jgi:catechol 2,3-dioxygenase-like lactoylglutathione lyase family enzyme